MSKARKKKLPTLAQFHAWLKKTKGDGFYFGVNGKLSEYYQEFLRSQDLHQPL